ncbi:glycerophosphodiester phosphodiesterase family protein [Leucobacter albus]|uniref:Glycerophosphodiester phosphodiesterase family protein n=1 Tax=Leucobacter albus TaxID=272210 RepID=A0ABW3TPU4_9MICO
MTRIRRIRRMTALLLGGAAMRLRAAGLPLLAAILLTQLAVFAIVLPVNQWLFREALRAVGHSGLDLAAPIRPEGVPFTIALIALIVLIAFWAMALQFVLFTVLLSSTGERPAAREQRRHLALVLRKMLRPSALPLIGYLFFLLPLTGFGFTSLLAKGIAIPPFISGELGKTLTSWLVLVLFLFVLGSINTRLALTVPIFALTTATGGRASRLSVRLTRGAAPEWGIVFAVATVLALAALAAVALFVVALLPTLLADTIAPGAAPAVAAVSLGVAQLITLVLTGGATAAIAAVLVHAFGVQRAKLPADVRELAPSGAGGAERLALSGRVARGGRGAVVLPALIVCAAVAGSAAFTAAGWNTLHRLHAAPDTLVLAHRGFSDGGVENTIGGLEAAAAAGADLVEMDVMETKDHRFVVMHDANLARLAGEPARVADLTLAELTEVAVTDLHGNAGTIPSLEEYLLRAAELEMPLLVEIKLGGNDSPDHVERLVAEMEGLGVLDDHMYHSLDAASVERLKRLRPDLTVGYTMAFAAVEAPRTDADMIVVEQWTATDEVQRSAERAGLGFFAWTVNDTGSMRDHLRRGTDGIVTDHPDEVVRLRGEMADRSGLAAVLFDALARFVTLG